MLEFALPNYIYFLILYLILSLFYKITSEIKNTSNKKTKQLFYFFGVCPKVLNSLIVVCRTQFS